jgi:hypothetical protein
VISPSRMMFRTAMAHSLDARAFALHEWLTNRAGGLKCNPQRDGTLSRCRRRRQRQPDGRPDFRLQRHEVSAVAAGARTVIAARCGVGSAGEAPIGRTPAEMQSWTSAARRPLCLCGVQSVSFSNGLPVSTNSMSFRSKELQEAVTCVPVE